MVPPELLHTTSEYKTEYMIFSFRYAINKLKKHIKNIKYLLEKMHQNIHVAKSRNSEQDLPASANRTRFFKKTQVNSIEIHENLFILLCICRSEEVRNWLFRTLFKTESDMYKFKDGMKLYLAMEEWFHETNPLNEVKSSLPLIAIDSDRP